MADASEATSFSDEDLDGAAGSVGRPDSASGSPRSYMEGGAGPAAAEGRHGRGHGGSWHRHDRARGGGHGGAGGRAPGDGSAGEGDWGSVGWDEQGGGVATHGGESASYASSSAGSPPVGSGGKQLARGRSHLTMAVSVGQGLIRGASILPAGKPSVAQRSAGHFGSGTDLHAAARAEKARAGPSPRPEVIPEGGPSAPRPHRAPAAEPAGDGDRSPPTRQASPAAAQPEPQQPPRSDPRPSQPQGGAGDGQAQAAAAPLPAAGLEQRPAAEGARADEPSGPSSGGVVSDSDVKSEGSAAGYDDDDFEDADAAAAPKPAPAQLGSLPPLSRAPSGPQVGMGGLSARGGNSTARTQASEPDWY
uniref:Uncharacterized protein n=1 Tax=Cafeteria roenbergensis TaxID=33653 RepID=A0A7S0K402_CAFRO